jgi:hypothetical protein
MGSWAVFLGMDRGALERPVRGEGNTVADQTHLGKWAERYADRAAEQQGEDKQTDAIGEGLAAVAYALLEVAAAVRENTAAR